MTEREYAKLSKRLDLIQSVHKERHAKTMRQLRFIEDRICTLNKRLRNLTILATVICLLTWIYK